MGKMTLSSELPEEIAKMLGDEGEKKPRLSKKKKIIISAVAVVTAGSIAVGTVFFVKSKKEKSNEPIYREYTVERGDILEGQTESSVITLDRETVEFPVNAEVLKVYVKAGAQVKKGDKLVKLSTDDIDESLAEYEADVASAKASLESAELSRKNELLKAKQEMESSEQSGEQADDTLATSLEQAAFELQNKEESVTKAQKEYDELYAQQLTFTADKLALDSAETWMNTRQNIVDSRQDKQDAYNEVNSNLNSVNNKIKQIADVSDMAQANAVLSELKEEYDTMYASYYSTGETTTAADSKGTASKVKLSELLKAEEKYEAMKDSMSTLESLFTKQEKYEAKLAKYDADAIEKDLSNAKKSLERAKEAYTDLQEEFKETYGNINDKDAMDEAVDNALNSLTKAQLDYQNQKTQYEKSVLTAKQNNESAASTASTAEKKYQLKALELDETVQKAQSSYDSLAEDLEEIKEAIENDGVMTAPCDGVVASVNVEEGDTVTVSSGGDAMFGSSSTATLMSITDTSEVYVSISISEEEILDVSLGQEATVSMSAFPDQTFDATVESISTEGSTLGAATVTYTVNVKFNEETGLNLYDGMSADVTLITDGVRDVLYVSKQAISTQNGTSTVLLKDEDGEPMEIQVTTGYSDGQYTEISSGLKEGDVVMAESAIGSSAEGEKAKGKSDSGNMPDFGDGEMPDFSGGDMPDMSGGMPNMGQQG